VADLRNFTTGPDLCVREAAWHAACRLRGTVLVRHDRIRMVRLGSRAHRAADVLAAIISDRGLRRGERTWGPRLRDRAPASAPKRPRMRLVSWKPLAKGSLRGFATVELPIGLKLIDCPVLVGPNGPWASLPSKPVLDRHGRQAKSDDKAIFTPVLEWRDRRIPHRSGAMLELLAVELASGIVVNELKLMTGANGPWIAMPAQKQLHHNGDPRFDATGKPIFNQIIEFADLATADRFQAMVLELICREYPEALDGRGAP
jgi:DNA-binding cell septation regulator SpoVG